MPTKKCYAHSYLMPKECENIFIDSVVSNGFIMPLIAREQGVNYEVYSGRKRLLAAHLAEIEFVPIIKRNLNDNETKVIIIESTLNQRGVDSLKYSELAMLITEYYSRVKAQGKRTDLLNEVRKILNDFEEQVTFRPVGEKLNSCKESGYKFSMSARNISRYLRVYKLINKLQQALDDNLIALRTAVELSYINYELQEYITTLIYDKSVKVTYNHAVIFRYKQVHNTLSKEVIDKCLFMGDKVFCNREGFSAMKGIYKKYGLFAYKEEEIERIVDQALGLYFKNITKVNWM